MITAKERIEKQNRETEEKYEKCKKDTSFYREMDDDRLLEEVARKFPGCSSEMCFACLDNDALVNELKRRLEEK